MRSSRAQSISAANFEFDDDDEEEEEEESQINWSDVIFLPFNPVFKTFVLFSVVAKSLLGPVRSVYSIVHCSEIMDKYVVLSFVKYYYWYLCDMIYFCDTFLHIVHRQVTDKALRREHLPKSAFLLLLDVISLIPFYTLTTYELCPPVQLWPNLLSFTEFIVIYRIVEHFSMASTHNNLKLVIGGTLLCFICLNCVGCFLVLLTVNGLCANCAGDRIYDWRKFVLHKLNETDEGYATYAYATSYVFGFYLSTLFAEIKPSTISEYLLTSFFMMAGYGLSNYVVLPKIFSEAILNLRRICAYHPAVKKIVEETKRRNPSSSAYIHVGNFYNLMWMKRRGITNIPEVITELPRYLRLDVKQDLVWPVFYHSPTLRNTSAPFKRWICDCVCLDYKLPGERFFAGPHCHTNLTYLKSGIIELLSADDGVTPLLSLSGGTIIGDVSFMVPPLKRNLVVRCVTYCEIFVLSRYDILRAMHKYPVDRKNIIASVKGRIKHARTLYTCKQHVRGLDRAEDEGIAWIKRRWWEISETISGWKKNSKNTISKCALPPEEAVYHCAKYIGQLVLCSEMQLHKHTLFANTKFPWILTPHSTFIRVWHYIVIFTVFLALITFPPNITRKTVRQSFKVVKFWVDFVYVADICVSLLTAPTTDTDTDDFTTVMFTRCKSINFLLDVFATLWIEVLALLSGKLEFYYVFHFNRLLKVYVLFFSEEINQYSFKRDLMLNVCYKVMLANFCFFYIISYVLHFVARYLPDLTHSYFFGEKYCNNGNQTVVCDLEDEFLGVSLAFLYEILFYEFPPHTLTDIYFSCVVNFIGFHIGMITKGIFTAYFYLKYRDSTNYQSFVSNLKSYYTNHKIHQDLMKRLNRYLTCQWKYYEGADVMHPNTLMHEPFDIYWKVQGEVAERIISQSLAFAGADPILVRQLAYAAKFLFMPKYATLFLFGVECKNVTWIVQGHIKCEYHNEEGELLKSYYNPGQMLATNSVLLRKPSLRTYASCTECELLYIQIQDFYNIIKRFPSEWTYFENCIKEFEPVFEVILESYVLKHRDYQKKLRKRIFRSKSTSSHRTPPVQDDDWTPYTAIGFESWVDPDSDWMYYWMMFRVVVVIVSIVSTSLQGGSGAPIRRFLMILSATCDAFAWIDIILKMFVSYFNEKGILIYETRMCIAHYLTRGFLLDIVGAVPWFEFFRVILTKTIDDNQAMLINTTCKFAHIYIVMAFFNHVADQPAVKSIYILILKWQVVVILVVLGASNCLMIHCIHFDFDIEGNLMGMHRKKECWLPNFIVMDDEPTIPQLHMVFAQSLNLAQSSLMGMNLGRFIIDRTNIGIGTVLVILGVIFWGVRCYSITLLMLASRENTLYQHGVGQLEKFLKAERVEQKLIDDATAHFGYWWIRNKGVNLHHLMNERIGLVFKQDLSYYFFKKTFMALDTLLRAGELIERQLSSIGQQKYLRPGEEVMREMDILPFVYVVHRGKVIITRDGEQLAELTKGGIFGQLIGTEPRPVRVSAVASGYADVLQIAIEQFQDNINDEVRATIAQNRQSKYDFMAVRRQVHETPHNTIEYLLRGRKTIKLPWMEEPVESRGGNWYSRWLYLNWMIIPFVSTCLVLSLSFVPDDVRQEIYWALIAFDIVFLAQCIAEFFTVKLVVDHGALVKRRVAYRLLFSWKFYVDAISLILPMMALIKGDCTYQLARLLRLRLLFEFHVHFCSSFRSRLTPMIMKFIIVILLVHSMVCGWIFMACRRSPGQPFPVPVLALPPRLNSNIDSGEWLSPRDRDAQGCSRISMFFKYNETEKLNQMTFIVPCKWEHDYIVALKYIVTLQTHNMIDSVLALTLKEVYYKLLINFFMLLLDMWLVSLAVSAVYTMYRELYQYDYGVSNLTTYFRYSGLSPILLKNIEVYTRQLWQRQRGNWLPELAQHAPPCLREDLLSALYIHHLNRPAIFKNLPTYFTRQLVARFKRVVIFPGECIVQEGDIFPCMYFIHEGEVEKWYTDANGQKKVMSLQTTNGYFGVIPGLYPNVPYQFSYYTRTVVDLVYLRLKDWEDLLAAYPNVRHELYSRAKQLKKELLHKNI
ncbi:hypothetical protein ABMA27_016755 [Loxostege sticticalis]|uniref:Cyclic nucleotide-binding domain-containing protein n=1 Tax=Loxostege sticticalis TaxID=481309 RepID=A0ABR3I3F0_LOXSC